MPTIETQILNWLSGNWPSVAAGLSVGITYVAAYLRLQTFLGRIDKAEKELLRLSREQVHLKARIAKIVLNHCMKYPLEMQELMKIEEDVDDGE